ncbi:hypothetical protein, partial [Microcoleus sp. K4-C2]|uniref:hypothetical protein n=1 Tax=Microcoleus sp. K4-C2 TaxID=2818792 RepID=UPI002FD2016C
PIQFGRALFALTGIVILSPIQVLEFATNHLTVGDRIELSHIRDHSQKQALCPSHKKLVFLWDGHRGLFDLELVGEASAWRLRTSSIVRDSRSNL